MNKIGVAESWRTRSSRYRLEGGKCKNCNKLYFPLKHNCTMCLKNNMEKCNLSGKGKIIAFTKIDEAAEQFDHLVPYYYGIIELEENIKISSQIIKPYYKEIKDGMAVQMTFRILKKSDKEGIILYGYKAELVE